MKINYVNAIICILFYLVVELTTLLLTGSITVMCLSCAVVSYTFSHFGFKIVEDEEDNK